MSTPLLVVLSMMAGGFVVLVAVIALITWDVHHVEPGECPLCHGSGES